MSNSLWPNELQHTSLPCSLLFPGVCLNSCPLSWWCYLTTLSASATLFSSCPQSLLVSGSFPISQLLHAQPPPAFHQFLSVTGSKDFPFHQISFYGFCLSRFWELQISLWPHFFNRSKKSYWFPVHFFFSFVVRMWFVICVHAKSLQSYLTHCDLMDHSPPGSFVHRILQARILEWVAMTSSTGSSQPMTWTSSAAPALQVDSLPLSHGGKHGWLFTCSLYITPESRRLTVL